MISSDVSLFDEGDGGAQGAARVFDGRKRDLGWAASVSVRPPALGGLTVLDVTAPDTTLASFLRTLDKGRLVVRWVSPSGAMCAFSWASGYQNGEAIRIQGVLEHKSDGRPRRPR